MRVARVTLVARVMSFEMVTRMLGDLIVVILARVVRV